jgi:signal transduction histidine kinase
MTGRPQDIASVVVFLASDGAAWMTGSILAVDGGASAVHTGQVAQVAAVTIENLVLIAALREADQRKDHFLATLAHELRNPLTPIVNAVTLLDRVASSHSGVARAKETIHRQVNQLVRLVDDLMDVSRVSQDRLELIRDVVVLRDMFELAIEAVRPALIEAA